MSLDRTTVPAGSAPPWVADAVFYQIFPDRFANADPALDPPDVRPWGSPPTRDGFTGGDLAGITTHLDHLVDLGVTALYLTPIFAAGTNHRYDTTDYFRIDPALGDERAFRNLLDQAHAHGLRVVLDAVLNHSGVGHHAFRDIVERGADSPFVNWYYTEDLPVAQRPVPNYRTCSGCWYLPKWNVHNPQVRDHHLRVARHWLELGIDGWRLDVPYYVPMSFWRAFRHTVKEVNPDAYVVAEEWRTPTPWLAGDTADGTMNYTLRDLILGFTADTTHDAAALAAGLRSLTDAIPWHARSTMLNLLGSHDTARVLTRHDDDPAATLLAYVLLLTSPGAPMLYYGDEIGMTGDNDPGCRGCMSWDTTTWDHTLHTGLRELIALRAAHPALRHGTDTYPYAVGDLLVRSRQHADQTILVTVNRGRTDALLPPDLTGPARLLWPRTDPATFETRTVPAGSARIWQVERP